MRTKTRLEQLTQEGCFTGGSVPYGYKLEKHGRIIKKMKPTRTASYIRENRTAPGHQEQVCYGAAITA